MAFSALFGVVVLPENEQSAFSLHVQERFDQVAVVLAALHRGQARILRTANHAIEQFAAMTLSQRAAFSSSAASFCNDDSSGPRPMLPL